MEYVFRNDVEFDVFRAGVFFGSHHQLINVVRILAIGVVSKDVVSVISKCVFLEGIVIEPIPVL